MNESFDSNITWLSYSFPVSKWWWWWWRKNQSQFSILSHCQCWLAVCQFESIIIIIIRINEQQNDFQFSILISWLLNDVECCYRFIAKLPRMKIEIFFFVFSLFDKILYLFRYRRTVFQLFINLNLRFFFLLQLFFQMLGISSMFWFHFALILMLFILLERCCFCFETWVNRKEQNIQSKNEHYELNNDNK